MKAKSVLTSLALLLYLSASAIYFTKDAHNNTNTTSNVFNSLGGMSSSGRNYANGMSRIVLNDSLAFADQLVYENTIYIVKSNFNLNGKKVTIPENCALEFEGGVLSNGTLYGQNTSIQAGLFKLFNTNVTIDGVWKVPEAYPEWFGAISGNHNYDSRLAIQKTLDGFSCTKLCGDEYYLLSNDAGVGVKVPYGKTLCGINHFRGTSNKGKTSIKAVDKGVVNIVEVDHYCVVKDINIEGNLGDYYNHTDSEVAGIYGYDVSYIKFENIYVVNTSYGFRMCAWCVSYINCRAGYCNIGFNVYGRPATFKKGAAAMTSNNFINCTCLCTTLCHFSLTNVIKCVFIGCGGDCCGYRFDSNGKKVRAFEIPASNQNSFYTNAVFRFESCSNFTLLNCATEMSFRALSMSSVSDINIEDFHFTFYCDDTPDINNTSYLSSVVFMSGFSGVSYKDNKTFYDAPEGWNGRYVTLNNYDRSNKHTSTFNLSKKEVNLSVICDKPDEVYRRMAFDYDEDIESYNPLPPLYVNNNRSTEYRILADYFSLNNSTNTSYVDFAGTTTLHFVGNATNQKTINLSSIKEPILFKGFKRVILENYNIFYDKLAQTSFPYSYLIKCEDTEVILKNCVIKSGSIPNTLENLIKCENCHLILENTYQVIETNDNYRVAATKDIIKSTISLDKIESDDLKRVPKGQLKMPSGTMVCYSNKRAGIYTENEVGHAPFETKVENTTDIPRFASIDNLSIAEKWFAIGSRCYINNSKILVTWNGERWLEPDYSTAGVRRSGKFAQRPSATDIYIGFRYFCTDKYTPEGGKDHLGIEIIYKGNNKWVDALGREL